jgi:di/tricarboxylate transporter
LIVSGFRASAGTGTFAMFDFTPVGLAVAGGGIVFILIVGWRLVPDRSRAGAEGFETGAYLTEARVQPDSKADGKTLREIEEALAEVDAQVTGLVRNEVRVPAPYPGRHVRADDILVIEADPKALAGALGSLGLKLEEDVKADTPPEAETDEDTGSDKEAEVETKDGDSEAKPKAKPAATADETVLAELAVLPDSLLIGRSASDIHLRTRYGINLLAISRQGHRSTARLRSMSLRAGDVLLMQGPPEAIAEFGNVAACVPLAERELTLPKPRDALIASLIMAGAIAAAAFGLLPAAIAFAGGVLAAAVSRVVSLRTIYDAVDWPVIVLLGALIPVAGAMPTSGTDSLIAGVLLGGVAQGSAVVALALILIVTMTLSDFMNNAATAAVMCPIAIGAASSLGVNPDAFLMAVAVGASCAFLTPIGHQNNTLILGPGGFHFGDYWRLGLPLEVLVIAIAIPMILLVWPL